MTAAAEEADPRFAQLRARDAAADGAFVYGVTTTGVYCRPSCPSRPAKPPVGSQPCPRCERAS